MDVGGVIHQVEHRRAAGDQAEGPVSRRGQVRQELAQVAALQQAVLIPLLVLHHLQPVQDEERAPRAQHGADHLRPDVG